MPSFSFSRFLFVARHKIPKSLSRFLFIPNDSSCRLYPNLRFSFSSKLRLSSDLQNPQFTNQRMATATYPPPPPYYRLYKDYSENPNSAPEPPPPIEGTYICFGGNYTTEDVLPSLEEQGVPQLYSKDSNVDYKKELRSLNRELQLHILELADVLVDRPSQYAKRIGEISSIFKNLHHLLNSLRPHQARATLIHIMELQIQQRKQAVEDIKRRREEAQRLLKDAFVTLDGQ